MISSYNLIGKNVLSLVSGNIIGVIKNIEIKNMRLSRIIAFNNESDIEEEFLFYAKNIYSFGENAITLKKEEFEIDETYLNNKIVGATLYNQEGAALDTIIDILIDESSLKIIEFVGENSKYLPTNISSINNGVIILKGKAKIVRAKNIKRIKASETSVKILNKTLSSNIETNTLNEDNQKKALNENSIKLKNDIIVDKNIVLSENSEYAKNENEKLKPQSPQKTLANFDFLLGRVVTNNIYSNNGKINLKLGDIINNQIVLTAFENNLLKDLLENSKTI